MHTLHFSEAELRCKCCLVNEMRWSFLEKLESIRVAFGKPMRLSSAYRCPSHNAIISRTGETGPHTTGHAVDIITSGADVIRLVELALTAGMQGLGFSQKGPHGSRFLHIDDLEKNRPWIWSY